MLHTANPSTKLRFQNVAIFWAFAAFFPAYVLTEALFIKRKDVIWVVVVSMEAIKLRSEVVWIEIISTLLLCWLYIPIRHGIFLSVFATIRSTNSLVSSSLSPRRGRKRRNEGTSPYPSQESLFTGCVSRLISLSVLEWYLSWVQKSLRGLI